MDGVYYRQNQLNMPFQQSPYPQFKSPTNRLVNREERINVLDDEDESRRFCFELNTEHRRNGVQRARPVVIENLTNSNRIVRCWNCEREGHRFNDCRSAKRGYFCYKCGKRGVILSTCEQCNSENQDGVSGNQGTARNSRRN